MVFYEIPLKPEPQTLTTTLNGTDYRMRLTYAACVGGGWILDIGDANGVPLVCGLPLVPFTNLLRQYGYLGIGGALVLITAGEPEEKPFGVKQGELPDALSQMKYPRPVTLFGMARDHLRTLAYSAGCTWNIRDDSLDVISKDGSREGSAIVLNSRTGLIGLPTQTEQGIVARCLINTQIGINSTVKIDQKSIQQAAQNLSYGGEPFNGEPYLPSLAADGLYRVVGMDHVGDTHGQPWYCELYCIARGGSSTRRTARHGARRCSASTPARRPLRPTRSARKA